ARDRRGGRARTSTDERRDAEEAPAPGLEPLGTTGKYPAIIVGRPLPHILEGESCQARRIRPGTTPPSVLRPTVAILPSSRRASWSVFRTGSSSSIATSS